MREMARPVVASQLWPSKSLIFLSGEYLLSLPIPVTQSKEKHNPMLFRILTFRLLLCSLFATAHNGGTKPLPWSS